MSGDQTRNESPVYKWEGETSYVNALLAVDSLVLVPTKILHSAFERSFHRSSRAKVGAAQFGIT